MLKKTAVVSSIVLVICLIAFTALCPIAISDSVKMAQQAAPAYTVLSELLQYSSDNVESVEFLGYWVDLLEVRPSVDNKIHVLTDNYRRTPATFTPCLLENGNLQLYCTLESPSIITFLTRENIQRSIIANLNNASVNRIVLELPASVSFVSSASSSRYYYNLSIDERITVLEPDDNVESDSNTDQENVLNSEDDENFESSDAEDNLSQTEKSDLPVVKFDSSSEDAAF